MTDSTRRSRILLIALLALTALIVVVAIIAVFARGGPTAFPADSPEGVVQRYSQAVVDRDHSEALSYLVPETADECDRVSPGRDDRRVTLVRTTADDDSARVDVLIVTTYGSGSLGSGQYESDGAFELVKVGDTWAIESTPWELAVCSQTGAW